MSPVASWLLIAAGFAVLWVGLEIANRWSERRLRRRIESELAEAAFARMAVTIASRNRLRNRTLRLDDMTPEQFREALEEIEREETL